MTDPLDLFDQAVAERPPEAVPTAADRTASREAMLEAAAERPARRAAGLWPLVGWTVAAAAVLVAWLAWPSTASHEPSGRPADPVAGGPTGPGSRGGPPAWQTVHDDPRLLETLAAPRAAADGVVTVVVARDAPLSRFRIDDRELDDWLRAVGVRPARIRVGGETHVLDLAVADANLGE